MVNLDAAVPPNVAAAERNWVLICYIIHVVGPLTGQLLPIIGVIMNHVFYGQSQTLLAKSHHRWMLRTFWFWLLWFVLALVIFIVGLGGLLAFSGRSGLVLGSNIFLGSGLILATFLWWWYRTILGLVRFTRSQPMYVPGAAFPWR